MEFRRSPLVLPVATEGWAAGGGQAAEVGGCLCALRALCTGSDSSPGSTSQTLIRFWFCRFRDVLKSRTPGCSVGLQSSAPGLEPGPGWVFPVLHTFAALFCVCTAILFFRAAAKLRSVTWDKAVGGVKRSRTTLFHAQTAPLTPLFFLLLGNRGLVQRHPGSAVSLLTSGIPWSQRCRCEFSCIFIILFLPTPAPAPCSFLASC